MYEHKNFPNLFIIDHPLIQHKLTQMRQKTCNQKDFKAALKEISLLMGYEITRNLELTTKTIETPIRPMEAPALRDPTPVIVPILRAGLGMSEGLEQIMPGSKIGHIGLYRDEKTHLPHEYLVKLPDPMGLSFILVDPMLATGHSAKHAIDVMVKRGVDVKKISFLALVGAPEGVAEFQKSYSDIPIYLAALDEKLNENAYIVPGLGDAGDRLFGTL